ncbi:DUF4232 domain-containing protein [Streptomonospora sp. PA3]|uniref:DUF4232 domain-containing protein n=1 Tax=Streptomonospora sp. PA3 TaxID=2607326 RepID=UPI0012DC33F8|nr:DUF4232 domain-containing protein [Streptomonospora sp. PA3]MUL41692.1 DUF4232 domain-containing protein [Streptomonospora sp. PA3]
MSVFTSTTTTAHALRTAAVAGAALPALLLGAPLAAAGTPASAGAATVPACGSHHLKLIENDRGAAAGTMVVDFALVRISDGDGACLIPGSLEVRWVDGDGEQVGSWARQRGEPGEPFVLAEGDAAEFRLFHANPGNYDPADCEPTEVAGIEYFVGEGAGSYKGMGEHQYACANPEIRGTSLSPVTPGPHN